MSEKRDLEKAKEVINRVFNEPDIRKACQPQNTFAEYLAQALTQARQEGREEAARCAEKKYEGHEWNTNFINAGHGIASAIRQLGVGK
jgi:hypothetical protein